VAVRTAQRWLARYRAGGPGQDVAGRHRARRLPAELPGLIEGLALRKPRPAGMARAISSWPPGRRGRARCVWPDLRLLTGRAEICIDEHIRTRGQPPATA